MLRPSSPSARADEHNDVPLVVIENLELAEKRYLPESTVLGVVSAQALKSPSMVRRAQLSESVTSTLSHLSVLDGLGEQVDDVVVSPEVGEVFEREVDRADHWAGAAQVTQFVELSLSAGHAMTIHPRADSPLSSD